MTTTKWPKILPPLTAEQKAINNDYMKYWLEIVMAKSHFNLINSYFNHGYVIRHAPKNFIRTLDIGAGSGEHILNEKLNLEQTANYTALEVREELSNTLKQKFPAIHVLSGDCQQRLPFTNDYFDRILAIHVLEHLPNLPAAIREAHRLCKKSGGAFSIVIPCEGGLVYSFVRRLTAKRIFEKRYKTPYEWHIKREHINTPAEIFEEISPFFNITHKQYFPFLIPSIHLNLFIGLTLTPK